MGAERPPGRFARPARGLSTLVGVLLLAPILLATAACSPQADPAPLASDRSASWVLTAWGERFEVFAEIEPPRAAAGNDGAGGEIVGEAHVHVTVLDGFFPLVDGSVEVVFRGPAGERRFRSDGPVRPGVFDVALPLDTGGTFDLVLRPSDADGSEEIRVGRVQVATGDGEPSRLLAAPAPRGAPDGGEPIDFLKEEQWSSDFSTAWVRTGTLALGVRGLARFRPPAGGERTVSAPVAGVVDAAPWPHLGRAVRRGEPLFRLVPRLAPERSLATLEADVATLDTELTANRVRLERLEELLEMGATSRREVEEVRARVETLETRHRAAEADLADARSARQGGDSATGGIILRSPLSGHLARVAATPGATVEAGAPLARVVRTDVAWIEVLVPPEGARRVAERGVRGVVIESPEAPPRRLEESVRLVSVAPELDPSNGTVTVLLEAPGDAGLLPGSVADAQVLLDDAIRGLVVPGSALVDDGGVTVVYLQLGGERFVRQPVRVVERQGERVLVEGLVPGQRLVTDGADAIRRSSLMAGGEAHGHVH